MTTSLADCLTGLGFKKLPNSGGNVNTAVAVFGDGGDGYFSHACIGMSSRKNEQNEKFGKF